MLVRLDFVLHKGFGAWWERWGVGGCDKGICILNDSVWRLWRSLNMRGLQSWKQDLENTDDGA